MSHSEEAVVRLLCNVVWDDQYIRVGYSNNKWQNIFGLEKSIDFSKPLNCKGLNPSGFRSILQHFGERNLQVRWLSGVFLISYIVLLFCGYATMWLLENSPKKHLSFSSLVSICFPRSLINTNTCVARILQKSDPSFQILIPFHSDLFHGISSSKQCEWVHTGRTEN